MWYRPSIKTYKTTIIYKDIGGVCQTETDTKEYTNYPVNMKHVVTVTKEDNKGASIWYVCLAIEPGNSIYWGFNSEEDRDACFDNLLSYIIVKNI